MKHIITLLTLISSTCANAQYFAPQGATWHYSEHFVGPQTYQEYFIKFEVVGDTIIDGISCSKIHKEDKMECYNREDDEFVYTSNDSVFFYDPTFLQFQLIYDFNANAGDSWEIIVFGGNSATDLDTNTVLVDSTDFITINGQNLKRLYVTYQFRSEGLEMDHSSTIIERIGDTKYMFNYSSDVLLVCDFNWSSGLRCYDDSILGLFDTGIADSCTYVEFYNDLFENQLSSFQLAPNPTTDFIEIRMENGIPDLVHFLDAQGRLLLKTEEQTIDLSSYQSGVYFIRVLQDGNWTSRRLVKH